MQDRTKQNFKFEMDETQAQYFDLFFAEAAVKDWNWSGLRLTGENRDLFIRSEIVQIHADTAARLMQRTYVQTTDQAQTNLCQSLR
jgi:hypothetical protein